MKTLITVFSHERLHHLKLCLGCLTKAVTPTEGREFEIVVIDDNSDDPGIREYLTEQLDGDKISAILVPDQKIEGTDHYTRGFRCAVARGEAYEEFLQREADYLLMLDDDIVVGPKTLHEALDDFEALRKTEFLNVGALTLHALVTHHTFTVFSSKMFAELRYSGEANCLFTRGAMVEAGNQYKPCREGFADHQFKAIKAAGFDYLTRIDPVYAVQHLGYGKGGSAIYKSESKDPQPFWVSRPYQVFNAHANVPIELTTIGQREKSQVNGNVGLTEAIQVPGFDIALYDQLVQEFGGAEAPKLYLERTAT